jgi:hypothetical protein
MPPAAEILNLLFFILLLTAGLGVWGLMLWVADLLRQWRAAIDEDIHTRFKDR